MPSKSADFAEHGISVIMPVHNGGAYLQTAVDSILGQSQVLLELILIDDHSTDGAINALPTHDALRICSSPKRGIVPALNHGLHLARGYWIARMDGDDIAEPHRLKTQVDFLQNNPDIDICGAQVSLFKDALTEKRGLDAGYRFYQEWINGLTKPDEIDTALFIESPIPHPTACMRKQTLLDLGGYQNPSWPEDYDLWCRAHLAGLRFAKPEGVLLHWRDYNERTSRQESRYGKPEFLKCKAHYLHAYLQQRNIDSVQIWGTGPTGADMHDLLEARGTKVSSFVDVNPKMRDQTKRDKPVYVISDKPTAEELHAFDQLAVIAVSTRGVRDVIRQGLHRAGWVEGRQFLFVA